MLSFVVITDTPQRLATFLTNRGIIQQATDPINGSTYYTGVNPGLEFVEVPNPIQTSPGSGGTPGQPGYVPPTYDTRHVYLVKFSRESEDADADGAPVDAQGNPVNQYDRTKLGKFVKNNSTVVTAPANYLINGQPAGNAYKINGQNVWLVREDPERFGVWQ